MRPTSDAAPACNAEHGQKLMHVHGGAGTRVDDVSVLRLGIFQDVVLFHGGKRPHPFSRGCLKLLEVESNEPRSSICHA